MTPPQTPAPERLSPEAFKDDYIAALRDERDGWKREADRLRMIATAQSEVAGECEAYRAVLARIDKMFGCDHASHGAEDCERIVDHVREAIDALADAQGRVTALEAERDALLSHLRAVQRELGTDDFDSRPMSCYVADLKAERDAARAEVERVTSRNMIAVAVADAVVRFRTSSSEHEAAAWTAYQSAVAAYRAAPTPERTGE